MEKCWAKITIKHIDKVQWESRKIKTDEWQQRLKVPSENKEEVEWKVKDNE